MRRKISVIVFMASPIGGLKGPVAPSWEIPNIGACRNHTAKRVPCRKGLYSFQNRDPILEHDGSAARRSEITAISSNWRTGCPYNNNPAPFYTIPISPE
jgi:hypothetical protein